MRSILSDCQTELDYVTQVTSLLELRPMVTEVRHHVSVYQSCGRRVKASPECRRSNVMFYDTSIKGFVVYLPTVQFLPHNRIASFFVEMFDMETSQGSMVNRANEGGKAVAPAVEKTRNTLSVHPWWL